VNAIGAGGAWSLAASCAFTLRGPDPEVWSGGPVGPYLLADPYPVFDPIRIDATIDAAALHADITQVFAVPRSVLLGQQAPAAEATPAAPLDTERLLIATATFAEPPPDTAGWWCADCAAFVDLAADRPGGLCLACGGRATTWREAE
jgi:hypothetical protein